MYHDTADPNISYMEPQGKRRRSGKEMLQTDKEGELLEKDKEDEEDKETNVKRLDSFLKSTLLALLDTEIRLIEKQER